MSESLVPDSHPVLTYSSRQGAHSHPQGSHPPFVQLPLLALTLPDEQRQANAFYQLQSHRFPGQPSTCNAGVGGEGWIIRCVHDVCHVSGAPEVVQCSSPDLGRL